MKYKKCLGVMLLLNTVSAMVMPHMVKLALMERGYWAYGGEWLLLWVMVIISAVMFFDNIKSPLNYVGKHREGIKKETN